MHFKMNPQPKNGIQAYFTESSFMKHLGHESLRDQLVRQLDELDYVSHVQDSYFKASGKKQAQNKSTSLVQQINSVRRRDEDGVIREHIKSFLGEHNIQDDGTNQEDHKAGREDIDTNEEKGTDKRDDGDLTDVKESHQTKRSEKGKMAKKTREETAGEESGGGATYKPKSMLEKPHEWSSLCLREQQRYFDLWNKYGRHIPVDTTEEEKAELRQFHMLKAQVIEEQNYYQTFLKRIALRNKQDYLYIHSEARKYVEQKLCHKNERITKYPKYYSRVGCIPLEDKESKQTGPPLQYIRQLLEVGPQPKVLLPNLGPVNPPHVPLDYKEVNNRFPSEPQMYEGETVWNHEPCSMDPNAESLAEKNLFHIVVSSSVLKCLIDTQDKDHERKWEIPVAIKEYEIQDEGGIRPHKVVYLDKPIIHESTLSTRDKNSLYHKYALKTLVTKLPPQRGRQRRLDVKSRTMNVPEKSQSLGTPKTPRIPNISQSFVKAKIPMRQSSSAKDSERHTVLSPMVEKSGEPVQVKGRESTPTDMFGLSNMDIEDLETFGTMDHFSKGFGKKKDSSKDKNDLEVEMESKSKKEKRSSSDSESGDMFGSGDLNMEDLETFGTVDFFKSLGKKNVDSKDENEHRTTSQEEVDTELKEVSPSLKSTEGKETSVPVSEEKPEINIQKAGKSKTIAVEIQDDHCRAEKGHTHEQTKPENKDAEPEFSGLQTGVFYKNKEKAGTSSLRAESDLKEKETVVGVSSKSAPSFGLEISEENDSDSSNDDLVIDVPSSSPPGHSAKPESPSKCSLNLLTPQSPRRRLSKQSQEVLEKTKRPDVAETPMSPGTGTPQSPIQDTPHSPAPDAPASPAMDTSTVDAPASPTKDFEAPASPQEAPGSPDKSLFVSPVRECVVIPLDNQGDTDDENVMDYSMVDQGKIKPKESSASYQSETLKQEVKGENKSFEPMVTRRQSERRKSDIARTSKRKLKGEQQVLDILEAALEKKGVEQFLHARGEKRKSTDCIMDISQMATERALRSKSQRSLSTGSAGSGREVTLTEAKVSSLRSGRIGGQERNPKIVLIEPPVLPEPSPKRGRGRPRKTPAETPGSVEDQITTSPKTNSTSPRRLTRKGAAEVNPADGEGTDTTTGKEEADSGASPVKRKRGRPPKKKLEPESSTPLFEQTQDDSIVANTSTALPPAGERRTCSEQENTSNRNNVDLTLKDASIPENGKSTVTQNLITVNDVAKGSNYEVAQMENVNSEVQQVENVNSEVPPIDEDTAKTQVAMDSDVHSAKTNLSGQNKSPTDDSNVPVNVNNVVRHQTAFKAKQTQGNACPVAHETTAHKGLVKEAASVRRKLSSTNPLDTILQMQSSMLKSSDVKEEPGPKQGTSHLQPTDCHVTYSQWQSGGYQVLVRCGQHGIYRPFAAVHQSKQVYLCPKLEYQSWHGVEDCTSSEKARTWMSVYLRPGALLIRARINAFTSELIMFEELDLQQLVLPQDVFSHQQAFAQLHNVFHKLYQLDGGQYLLTHTSEDSSEFNILRCTENNKRGPFDLHFRHCYKEYKGPVPWMPLDTNVLLPFHKKMRRIPGTFMPEDYKDFKRPEQVRRDGTKKKKKKKKKK